MNQYKFRSKIYRKKPLSIIVNGINRLGFELANILLENNGYVLFIDKYTEDNLQKLDVFSKDSLISFLDFSVIPNLDEDLSRLDYVFYLNHDNDVPSGYIQSQKSYLDIILSLSSKYSSKFLLTTPYFYENESTELLKYSVDLVNEYKNKVGLDTRIVVFGDIIGDGMNLLNLKPITKIIVSAAKGENIPIPRNGLEKRWYINIFDAAEAIYKAQVSRITKGNIYLASYQNPHSFLSIAYKIQEIEKDAKEIDFYEYNDVGEHLFNEEDILMLDDIGWKPAVPIEKGLLQSVSAAKVFIIENTQGSVKSINKIRAFFESEKHKPSKDEELFTGPVGKLILERKRQLELSKHSLSQNSLYLESIDKKNRQNIGDIIDSSKSGIVEKFQGAFSSFKNESTLNKISKLVLIFGALFFYLFVISPIVIFLRDVGVMYFSFSTLQSEVENSNYQNVKALSEKASGSLNNLEYITESYSWIFQLTFTGEQYKSVKDLIRAFQLSADAYTDILHASEQFFEYVDAYGSNLTFSNSNGLLLTGESGDYDNFLLDILDKSNYFSLARDRFIKAESILSTTNIDVLPVQVQGFIYETRDKLEAIKNELETLSTISMMPEILGIYSEKTYALVVLDDKKSLPLGGEVVSVVLLSVINGDIEYVQSVDIFDPSLEVLIDNSDLLETLNSRKFNSIRSIKNISDLSYFYEIEDVFDSISLISNKNWGKNVDGGLILTSSSLSKVMDRFSDRYEFNYNGRRLGEDGVQGYIDRFVNKEEEVEENSRIYTSLSSQLINNVLDRFNENYRDFFEVITDEILNSNAFVYSSSSSYNDFLARKNYDGSQIGSADIFIKPFVESASSDRYSLSSNVLVTNDNVLSFKVMMRSLRNDYTSKGVCIPLFVRQEDINVINTRRTDYKIVQNQSEQCIIIDGSDDGGRVEISFNVRDFRVEDGNAVDLLLSFGKVRGQETNLNMLIKHEPAIKLNLPADHYQEVQGGYLISEDLLSDKSIRLTISR